MQDSNAPTPIPLPWGASAASPYINTIPTASQIGINNGRASFTDGFVPLNFQPIAAGGVPPFGGDFNGILAQVTAGLQWLQAGAPLQWSSAFSALIGGYPNNSVVASATTAGLWYVSTIDNNTTNPDAGGSNWVAFSYIAGGLYSDYITATGSGNWTATFSGLIQIEGWAGGGGSSAGQNGTFATQGAGSGAYFRHQQTVTNGTVYPYVVGAGGAASSFGVQGGTGGTTTWNSGPTALGGTGSSKTIAGLGQAASGANILNITGYSGQTTNSAGSGVVGACGAPAPYGGNGGAGSQSNANPGGQPGGGAGGPGSGPGANYPGQAGGAGAILITRLR